MTIETRTTLDEIARRLGGEVLGDGSILISSADDVRDAGTGGIVFAEDAKFFKNAVQSNCSAIIVTRDLISAYTEFPKPLLVVGQPRIAFAQVLQLLAKPWILPPGIHPTAVIEQGVTLGIDVRIGAQVWVAEGTTIGNGVTLMAGVKVGSGCTVGDGTILYPNVVLYPGVRIGRGCLLHAGCVLGADGFGYVPTPTGLLKIPHVGSVQIGDGVEIGANSCIDRAKTGVTSVGSGTKIDNLVHVAHNVKIGRASVLVAQTGVAGSVNIGDGVMLGGQSGVADHITIGDGARIGAQGGVIGNVAPKESVSGYPARPHARKMREYAALAALPEYLRRIRDLEKKLARLEESTMPGIDPSI